MDAPSAKDIVERPFHVCFSVGGVRGVFHLGAVHALLMSKARAPGIIAGSSVGAAHGAMLAHLLGNEDEHEKLEALRQYVDLVLKVPNFTLLGAPDLRDVLRFEPPPWGMPDPTQKRQNLKALVGVLLSQKVSMHHWGKLAKAWVGWRSGTWRSNALRKLWHLARAALTLSWMALLIRPGDWYRFVRGLFRSDMPWGWDRVLDAVLLPYGLNQGLLPNDDIRELLEQAIRQPTNDDADLGLGALANEAGVELVVCAADLHTARLTALPPHHVKAIDALMAAMAVPGIWPPVSAQALYGLDEGQEPPAGQPQGPFVDAVRVAFFPIRQLLFRLKRLIAEVALDAGGQAGTVTDMPAHTVLAIGAIPAEDGPRDDLQYDNMVDVVERSFALQAYTETSLDMKLARVVSDTVQRPGMEGGWARQTQEVLDRLKEEGLGPGWNPRRAESNALDPIEDLCIPLNLEVVQPAQPTRFRHITRAEPDELATLAADGCRRTLAALIRRKVIKAPQHQGSLACADLMRALGKPAFKLDVDTPGLPEICRHCTGVIDTTPPPDRDTPPDKPRLRRWMKKVPQDRPVIAMTLAGGVFKGVFQLGVVHAVQALGGRPQLLAGASVGTLVAAQASRIFAEPDAERQQRLLHEIAHMFVTQDRWVPTPSWREFAKGLLRRFSTTRLRLSDINRLFRNYGRPWAPVRRTLRTAEAFQRLAFIWPHQLLRLWDQAYTEDLGGFWLNLREQVVRGLRGYDVPLEVLGAQTIQDQAWQLGIGLWERGEEGKERKFRTYDDVLERGIALVATTTDLIDGRIRLLGFEEGFSNPALLPAVFASSAFPGLFRPRRESEVFPFSGRYERLYSDGGIFNNNPLNEVARWLRHCSKEESQGAWLRDPTQPPHLIIAASLETPIQLDPSKAWNIKTILGRTGEVAYNYKLKRFTGVQKRLRRLIEQARDEVPGGPLKLEVRDIYPSWLVPTFGATRAMGFNDQWQVDNIAHGCFQTLDSFTDDGVAPHGLQVERRDPKGPESSGICPWFRRTDGTAIECLFAGQSDADPDASASANRVYRACRKPKTHQKRERSLLLDR